MKSSHPLSPSARRGLGGVGALLVATLFVAGCGGGDDDRPGAAQAVPASASANATGFIDYLRELVVASADNLEPVDTTGFVAPVDDTASPAVVTVN